MTVIESDRRTASELLARLREQRATEAAAKKKPKRKAARKKKASVANSWSELVEALGINRRTFYRKRS